MPLAKLAAPLIAAAMLASLAAAASASAADPAIWKQQGATTIDFHYWQGVTSVTGSADPSLLFTGIADGAFRTNSKLTQLAASDPAIPAAVRAAERYNHIGDASFDQGSGGRLLLPVECYYPGAGGNTCKTGAIGVANPQSLAWRYYVKLDPAEIAKAMWVEADPAGQLLWTSSGSDLLAYRAADVVAKNAAPLHGPIKAARKLIGAVPPTGVTGAVFWRGRLLLAGQSGQKFQIWSVNVATGARTLELEKTLSGESEGLDIVPVAGGLLQWQLMPATNTPPASYPQPTLLSFLPKRPPTLKLSARADGRKAILVTVTTGPGQPIPHAAVRLGAARGWSGRDGRVRLNVAMPKRRTTLTATLTGTRSGSLRLGR